LEAELSALLLVGLGGVLGANARYLVSSWAAGRFGTAFPYGTFLINVSGSFLIGLILTLVVDRLSNSSTVRLLVATGFLGAYTTFSTFAYETVALLRQGDLRPALINALGSAALGVSGASAGILLAELLAGRVI
jgi:CrcB protein